MERYRELVYWNFGIWTLCCRFGVVWGADQGCKESVKVNEGPNERNERMLYERVTIWAGCQAQRQRGGRKKERKKKRKERKKEKGKMMFRGKLPY